MTRYGPSSPSAWIAYCDGEALTTNMSAPTVAKACPEAPDARQVEWLFLKPGDVTAYTLHYGRWVAGPNALDHWVQMGTIAEASAGTAARMVPVPAYNSHGDRVAVYIDGITGTPAATMKLWFRVVP